MRQVFNKLAFVVFLLISSAYTMLIARDETPPDPGGGTGGGTGSGGTGRPASPIDAELWILIAVGIIFITMFALKYRKRFSTN